MIVLRARRWKSHSRTVPSREQDSKARPSWLHCTAVTSSRCPSNMFTRGTSTSTSLPPPSLKEETSHNPICGAQKSPDDDGWQCEVGGGEEEVRREEERSKVHLPEPEASFEPSGLHANADMQSWWSRREATREPSAARHILMQLSSLPVARKVVCSEAARE